MGYIPDHHPAGNIFMPGKAGPHPGVFGQQRKQLPVIIHNLHPVVCLSLHTGMQYKRKMAEEQDRFFRIRAQLLFQPFQLDRSRLQGALQQGT